MTGKQYLQSKVLLCILVCYFLQNCTLALHLFPGRSHFFKQQRQLQHSPHAAKSSLNDYRLPYILLGVKLKNNYLKASFLNSRRSATLAMSMQDSSDSDYAQESSYPTFSSSDNSMKQLLVRFNCESIDPDEISELLSELGCLSVSVEVESERPGALNDEKNWFDLVKTSSWSMALLKATVPLDFELAFLKQSLLDLYPNEEMEVSEESLMSKDWVSHVQQMWHPQVVDNLTICLPWHDISSLEASIPTVSSTERRVIGKQFLVLEGGAAFGTGDHPTTRLCCSWLQKQCVESSKPLTVLDYGCGSAVLGLCALKFGAKAADGVDIDKDALLSAKRNAERNGVQMDLFLADDSDANNGNIDVSSNAEIASILLNRARGSSGDSFPSISQIDSSQYDLVVANILAPILISLAPKLAAHTIKGGRIALSGIIAQQANVVVDTYKAYFSDVKVEKTEDDWVLITGRR